MRRPLRIGRMRLVEIREHGGEAIAQGHQREENAGEKIVVEHDAHGVSPSTSAYPAKFRLSDRALASPGEPWRRVFLPLKIACPAVAGQGKLAHLPTQRRAGARCANTSI